jgi:flagellar basal body-associated protein FliL
MFSFNKQRILFSLLLISIVLSLYIIENLPSMLLFGRTNAQTSMNSTITEIQNQTAQSDTIVYNMFETLHKNSLLSFPLRFLT